MRCVQEQALLRNAQAAGGRIIESRNRVVSAPKEHGKRVTLLAMTRCAPFVRADITELYDVCNRCCCL